MGDVWEGVMKKNKSFFRNIDYLGILGLVAALTIWCIAAEYVKITDPLRAHIIMPAPYDVFTEGLKGIASFKYGGEITYANAFIVIAQQSLITIGRLLGGVTIGIAAGVIVGIFIGINKYLRQLFALPVFIIRAIPALALIPLFIIWFGGSEIGNIVYIAFIVFSMIVVNTIVAIRNVNPIYINFARTLGAKDLRILKTVILPAVVPELAGGTKVVKPQLYEPTLPTKSLTETSIKWSLSLNDVV